MDLSLYDRLYCLFSSRNSYLLFWIFPCMRDCTAYSLQGILICYFGSLPVWETVLPVLFKEFLFAILNYSLYERLYSLFSSRNSQLLLWIFPCMRDCTAYPLQGILICYFYIFPCMRDCTAFSLQGILIYCFGSFPVWETVLPVLFKEFFFAILDLSLYERLYCVISSRNSYLLFWIFAGMRDCTACSLQRILICYFGSFPVWETVLPVLFKEFLFAILDLSLYERWNCVFSSRISYLLFWIFPCLRDETASSLKGFFICYFGSFPVWEMKLLLLFKDFLFAILDLSQYERWKCLFSSRISYLQFWIFPCMRDCTASFHQGTLSSYFGSFPVLETVLPVLFKEFLFAILDLSLYERWNCLFFSRISY